MTQPGGTERRSRRASTAAEWDGRNIAKCAHCERFLKVILRVTFNTHARRDIARNGLQPWCRECDERRKATDRKYGWTEFCRVWRTDGTRHHWTKAEYLERVEADRCHHCRGKLSDWGKGHNIDRIDSLRPHEPDNCVACCAACNRRKGSMHPEAWRNVLEPLLARYPYGIPWDKIDDKGIRRVNIPDLRAYVVDVQPTLGPGFER